MSKNYKTIIIGAGISGLTIANSMLNEGHDKEDLLILEAGSRVGGLIKTDKVQGFLCEYGPEGLRGNSENTNYLFDLIREEPIPASNEASIRYLIHKNKMRKIPSGPLSAIFTPLVPFFGKFRLLFEPFVKPVLEDETVGDFIKRRLGVGAFPIIDAFVAGVYGGDPNKLSTRHAFPMFKQLEDMKGSLIKGGLAMSKAKKKKQKELGIEKQPKKEKKPFLMSSLNGMQGIVESLASRVNILTNKTVEQINPNADGYEVVVGEERFSTENLIVASGVNGARKIKILNEHDFNEVEEAKVAVVSLGYDPSQLTKEVKGYGFLSPTKENTFVLGTLFTSRLFPHHAPDGKIHLRCFVGGIRSPNKFLLSDQELITGALEDVSKFFGANSKPIFASVFRHENKGIPQLMMGHEEIIAWRTDMESKYSNLHFAGVGWTSIACDGLITEARKLAQTIPIEIRHQITT